MSAGVRSSASGEFDGLDIEHDAKQISFPGYKVSILSDRLQCWLIKSTLSRKFPSN